MPCVLDRIEFCKDFLKTVQIKKKQIIVIIFFSVNIDRIVQDRLIMSTSVSVQMLRR